MANVVKNPNDLNIVKKDVKSPYTNPLDGRDQKAQDWTDKDDAFYWAFQDYLDTNDDDYFDFDALGDILEQKYDDRFDGSTYPKREFIHEGLNLFNEHNKINPKPRRSDIDLWRERAARLAADNPKDVYFQNLNQIANDRNGVDHSDKINEIINLFGFNRRGEW